MGPTDIPVAHGTPDSRNAALERARTAKMPKAKQLPPVNFANHPAMASGSGSGCAAHKGLVSHESIMQVPYEKVIPDVGPVCQKRRTSKEMPMDPSDPSLLTPLKQLRLWLVGQQQQPRWRPSSVPVPVPGPEGLNDIFVTPRKERSSHASKRSARSQRQAEADWDAWEDDCETRKETWKENERAVLAVSWA